ncbi:MAG: ABC transporter ATP-binding protein/permease [Bacteroidales bacterium]|nr:ABC transporter ATP-binding protein/permease [Bacteroidales bacterium]
MKNLMKVLKYVLPYWGFTSLNILFNVLSILFSLVTFAFFIPIFDILFNKTKYIAQAPPPLTFHDVINFDSQLIKDNFYYQISELITKYGELNSLLYISISIVILFFLKNIFRYLAMYFLAPVRNGVIKDMRNELYLKILILPLSYYTRHKKGDLIARMTSDVQDIEWSIMSSLEMIFREPITILTYLLTLFLISPSLTIFVLVLLPVSGFLIGRIGKSLKRTSVKGQKKMGVILSIIEETISGLRIIKAFNAINITNKKFQKTNKEYTRLMIKLYRKRDLASPLSELLGAIVLVIVLWFGGRLVLNPDSLLDGTVFIVYLGIFSQLIPPAKAVTTAVYNIQKGAATVERIQYILNAEEVIEEKSDAISKNEFNKEIEYKNVSFSYEKDVILDNINLNIQKGKTIALVGQSGGGKSTMVDLLPRFYDCTKGEILIDGVNVKDIIISDVRGLMGIVTQESILFNDTVFNNIAFGMHDISEEQVIAAAKVANAHEFISKMENGYHTSIGDRGVKLSGGQKQRISIARAVLKNPPILILDEATSSLDTESERLVQDALIKLLKNRTSVIIAHRLSTVQFANEIIVIQKGKLVERGTHSELLALNGVYKKLYDLQSLI